MRQVHLMAPVIQGQTVTFQWRVEPESALYRRTHFTISFPSFIDLLRVPARLWWDLFIICLHPHWLLLRPCEVHLPLRLDARLRQFWLQMLQNGSDTLDAYGPSQNATPLGITIVDGDVDVPYEVVTGSGFGTSFSGGKDSLLQAGLLLELTERPLLVATTSPMPPLADHITDSAAPSFRSYSDSGETSPFCRGAERFSQQLGQWFRPTARLSASGSTNSPIRFSICPAFLQQAPRLGITRLFVASEAEVQVNAADRRQDCPALHFMYSAGHPAFACAASRAVRHYASGP